MEVKRGEVWWADLPGPGKRRPVLLISRDEAYNVRSLVIIAPITTHVRGIASEEPMGPNDALPRVCAANFDTIMTIPKVCLVERLAGLNSHKLKAVEDALHFALGLSK